MADPRPERIGEDYEFSGEIFRIRLGTGSTVIAKFEEPDRHDRAVAAHQIATPILGTGVPDLYGSDRDEERAVILLEDITGAQGDDLVGCTPDQAMVIVRLMRSLHSGTRLGSRPPGVEEWAPRAVAPDEFRAAIERAKARYPRQLGSIAPSRLDSVAERATEARRRLADRPRRVIHCDPHLDNILWRGDGSPVLVDWSNARFGPVGVDLAALLVGYSLRDRPALAPAELLDTYGEGDDPAQVESDAALGLDSMVAGLIGWAGEASNAGFHPRKRLLRDDAAVRIGHVLDWLDEAGR